VFRKFLRPAAAALFSTTALIAIASPAQAQSLDVPAGTTHALTVDESADALSGAGEINLSNYVLTVGADGSSSTFDGNIVESGWALAGTWTPYDGPTWTTGTAPTRSAVETAALLFGGSAADYRISSVSNQAGDIDDKAWYDVYAVGRSLFADDYKVDGNGNGLYDQPGDTSAYVHDNFVTDTNYAFTLESGIGGLTKVGAGTLTLNGTGDWSGTTTISGGSLVGTTASISGSSIVNDASLVYDQDFDGTVAQSIGGTGSLTKLGTGTVTLTGVTDYSGDTLIQEGTLALSGADASLGNSRVVVDGTLDVSQTLSAGVNIVDKVDAFYGTFLGSTTAGVSSTLNWQAAGYAIDATFAFTDASGRISSVIRTSSDNYTFYNVLSGDPLIGTQCTASANVACLVATGSAQSLIPALTVFNGGSGLFDGSAGVHFDVVIKDTFGRPEVLSLAGSGSVNLGSAQLAINNAADEFSGVISGTGSIEVRGGTQVLSGANTYSGGTIVNGGIVRALNAQAFGTGQIMMVDPTVQFGVSGTYANDILLAAVDPAGDPARLEADSGVAATLSGAITEASAGQPLQFGVTGGAGTASFILTNGGNSWTGTTTIEGGVTLQGTTASISGSDIVNNSILIYDQDVDGTLTQLVSGSGSLGKAGAGNVTLAAANSYTGMTGVLDGTLSLGADERIADVSVLGVAAPGRFDLAGFTETVGGLTGDGTVVVDGTLVVDQDVDTQFAGNFTDGAVSATDELRKSGTGLLDLTGTSDFAGTVTGAEGTLAVNGSLANAAFVVLDGGRLQGNGTLGSLVVNSGAVLAPGNSIGHLSVTGGLTFAAGSTYEVEISPTMADLTSAGGNIVIDGGTVSVLAGAGVYSPLTDYLILESGGTVTGTFDGVTSDLAFLDPTLVYTADEVHLQMRRNDIAFSDAAVTPNEVAVSDALQSLESGALYDAILVQPEDGARTAYNALSGEIYASTPAVLAQQGDRLRIAMLDADAIASDGFALWADAKAGHSSLTYTRAGSRDITADHRDMLAGLQWRGGGFSMVAGGGISGADVSLGSRGSKADVNSSMLGAQLAFRSNRIRLSGGIAFAWHDIDTDRSIVFPGFTDATRASQDGTTRTIYAEAAYQGALRGLSIEPFAGLSNQRVRIDGVLETGGDASLAVGPVKLTSTMSEVGIRFGGADGGLHPVGTVAWQHLFGDRTGRMTAAFDIGGDPFTIGGARRSRNALRVNAGVGYRVGSIDLGLGYDGRLAGLDTDHGVRLTAALKF
jgi:autotransporter-associated beta strand protein